MPGPTESPAQRVSDEVSPEELSHPESLRSVHVPARVAGESDGLWSASRRGLTLGLVLTITLVAAEALAVTAAMPIVARDLGGLELYGLVFSSFFVGSMLGIVIVGALIDRQGVLVPFVAGLVLFAAGLTIAGLAPSMPFLVGARFIQGIGGGAIPPVAYVAIGRSLPEHLRPRMFAMLSTAWILPGVFGPALAGIVAEVFHWRLVFLGLLPLILVSGTMAGRALRHVPAATIHAGGTSVRQRIGEAVIVAAGVALLTAGLTSEQPALTVGLGGAGTALTLFAFRRLTPPGTLRIQRGYPSAVLLRGFLTFAFFCVDTYVALLLVEVRGWSAAAAGIALTAATVSWTAGSWTQARLSTRYSPEWFVRRGFPVVALGIAGLGLVLLPGVPAGFAVLTFALGGFGMGLTYSQFALIVLRDAPAQLQGRVTSGLTLSDALGTALGTAVSGAIVAASVRGALGPGPGIGVSIAIGSAVAMAGFVLAPRLHVAANEVPRARA
jgi:MFS family permease